MNPFQKFQKECKTSAGKYADLLEQSKHADLALPCFSLAKELKKNPAEIASELSTEFQKRMKKSSLIKEIRAVGHYVNFYINEEKLQKLILKQIAKEKNKFGAGKKKKEKIMVEYSAPNSNKPLHLGHLRNDSIGMAISNILNFSGFPVTNANLVNDRGIHICKSMLAYEKWGQGKTPKSEKIKSDHFVGDYYVLFEKNKNEELENELHEMLVKWEKKDKKVLALWKKMNKWWLTGAKQTYKKFGSAFDTWFFESKLYDKATPIINLALRKNIFFKDEKNAIVADLEKYGLPNKTVLREDGTSIYITNDLALTKHKFDKFKISKSIWVVASEQNLYFKQLFKIFELLGYNWAGNCYHLSYGLVNLPSGRMKSREGTVIDADDLIKNVTELAEIETKQRYPKIKEKEVGKRALPIALAAIKYYLIKVDPVSDILFDPDKAIKFEGDTGPYLQYTFARANSILVKSKNKMMSTYTPQTEVRDFSACSACQKSSLSYPVLKGRGVRTSLSIKKKSGKIQALDNELEVSLIKKLASFPEIIEKCVRELKPNHLANYLFELATAFNEYYHNIRVIGSEKEKERILLVQSVAQVLENGLNLLNIPILKRM